MADTARKAVELANLLKDQRRITVRRAQLETGLSQRTIYRYVKSISRVIPMRIQKGIILLTDEENP